MIKIRKLTDNDISEFKKLLKEFKEFEAQYEEAFKTDDQAVEELYEAEMKGDDKYVYLAIDEKEPVGFISFEISTKNDPLIAESVDALYISGILVKDSHMGKGIAQELMLVAENFAKERNIKFLKLLVFSKNKLARDFYFKNGFEDYESTMIRELE